MEKGTFSESGTYYYSESLPQGSGSDLEYNKKIYENLSHVMNYFHNVDKRHNISNEDMKNVQRNLIEIGYLDPGDDDGYMGPMTMGAINRYRYNFANDHLFDQVIDTIQFWK